MARILIADDHPILLKGLEDQLIAYNYKIVGKASNGADALNQIIQKEPDVAILDIEMPLLSGFEVIKKSKEKNVKTKFIILTSYKEKRFILKAKELNIFGYLLKDENASQLDICIQKVLKEEPYFSKTFNLVFEEEISPEIEKIKFLSPSERTIIRLIAQEKSSKEIAEILTISSRTVEKHRANIIKKLALSKTSDTLSSWVLENKELILTF